jgi:aromatic ring-opening dioxygenase catalytic subunit (LigB family)
MMEIWPVMAPHSPDLLSSWKAGSDREMLGGFVKLRQELFSRSSEPFSAVIAYTPGWQTRHVTLVDAAPEHCSSRDFAGFGHHYQYDPPGDPVLARRMMASARTRGISIAEGIHGVDHAISVPLFFLLPEGVTPVVPVSQSLSGVRQASLLGESLRKLESNGLKRLLLLVSGVWSQNPLEMAKGQEDPLIPRWTERIMKSVLEREIPDWSFLPEIGREILDRLDPPGRLRELHLLKGLDVRGGRLWAWERIPGLVQVLASFEPVTV